MRILIVGAGAIGGYFGGRLLEAGADITFLVRSHRGAKLAANGLVIRSPFGNVTLPAPATVSAEGLRQSFDHPGVDRLGSDSPGFDLVLLSCKAYDLQRAIDDFTPAVGRDTVILPLLNGMRHLDVLDERFGAHHVLGGQCLISVVLDEKHEIMHLNNSHDLSFGERDGKRSARVEAIAEVMHRAKFNSHLSEKILHEMWAKWVFIATGAGITSLMRATVGDIVAAGATDLLFEMLKECAAIATEHGFPPTKEFMERNYALFSTPGSTLAASMLRDIERGGPVEADHILGDLLHRDSKSASPVLRIAYLHLKTYEARRARLSAVNRSV